jgi:hypothetical protein
VVKAITRPEGKEKRVEKAINNAKAIYLMRGASGEGPSSKAYLSHIDGDKGQQKHEHCPGEGQNDRHHRDDVFDGVVFVVFRGLGGSAGHTKTFK